MRDRRVWIVALAVAALAAILLAGAPGRDGGALDPDGTGPLGAKALVLLLKDQGATVDVTDGALGANDTALLLADQLGDEQRAAVLSWVRAGGTLVVADPRSPLAGAGGLSGVADRLGRNCDLPALRETGLIEVTGGVVYRLDTAGPGAIGCYGRSGKFYAVARSEGAGTVIALGGPAPFLNQDLGKADNSVLAVSLLAPRPGTGVAFVRPAPVGGGHRKLSDLISPRLKLAFLQLVIAFLLLCLWRARRLGRPVLEPQPVQLAGSELVVAVGNLLQQARRRNQAAAMLQQDLRRQLGQRLSLGPDAPAELVADVTAVRTGLDRDAVLRALTAPAPDSDAALVALARATEEVRQEVLSAR